jgi:hypothetical protein
MHRILRYAPLFSLVFCAGAFAEQIELANGGTMQGNVRAAESTDDALALELFETGGVVLVRWDHIEESRRKQIKEDLGFGSPTDVDEILVDGHELLLTNGTRDTGLVLNEAQKDQPLRLQTSTGEKTYPRENIAKVTATQVPGLLVHTPAQLYQILRDKNPPESARAHKDLGLKCMQIGALPQAREHLNTARGDDAFMKLEGRVVDGLLRDLDILEKSAGAREMVTQIEIAIRSRRWNDAKTKLEDLAKQYTDETVRKKIRFSLLETKVMRGRDDHFRAELPRRVQKTMLALIDAKAKERKAIRENPDAPRSSAPVGTLAAARQWAAKDLPKAIWDKSMSELGLTTEEMDAYWKVRSNRVSYSATYGTGSFIVAKKAAPAPGAPRGDAARRPAGSRPSDNGSKGGPPKAPQTKERAMTDEEWWEILAERPSDRARWLTAYFVENSGFFELLRVDESEPIPPMDGVGTNVAGVTLTIAGNVRKITYR